MLFSVLPTHELKTKASEKERKVKHESWKVLLWFKLALDINSWNYQKHNESQNKQEITWKQHTQFPADWLMSKLSTHTRVLSKWQSSSCVPNIESFLFSKSLFAHTVKQNSKFTNGGLAISSRQTLLNRIYTYNTTKRKHFFSFVIGEAPQIIRTTVAVIILSM